MKIDKAIELQETYLEAVEPEAYGDLEQAIQIGIEALKLVKKQRGHRWVDAPKPLPGETT